MTDIIFIFICTITVLSAAYVAISGDLVRSAFMLLLTLTSTAGIYAMLGSDLLAVLQLLVYVGGILVVILFAIMLTKEIAGDVKINNPSRKDLIAPLLLAATFIFILFVIITGPDMNLKRESEPVSARIGALLLTDYILPFELISFLLLIGMVGTVYIVRYSRRDRPLKKKQDGSAK
jgi:NADH-quinone oxidoreductase subunit J